MNAPDRNAFPLPGLRPDASLDRTAAKRGDKAWLAERLGHPRSRFLLLAGLKLSVDSEGEGKPASVRWLSPDGLVRAGASTSEAIFLGCDSSDRAIFAARLSDGDLARRPDHGEGLKPLVDLRSLAMQGALAGEELAIAATARALVAWHEGHRCCGRCGGHTRNRDAGWKRQCWACGQEEFPRADPAIIVLVSDGKRCLLGHHKRYANKFYSTLAGFVEPGEDIETAVRREIQEETGIEIGAVTYLASQPWPFPHSLMIGCWAEALSTEIAIDEQELWDARWFTPEEVRAMMEGRHGDDFAVPGAHSIAHSLIRSFAEAAP